MIMAIEHSWGDPLEVGRPSDYELGGLAVAPAHRRQGLAQALLGRATRFALARSNRTIFLQTDETRLPGIRLYLAMGYVPLLDDSMANRERWAAILFHLAKRPPRG